MESDQFVDQLNSSLSIWEKTRSEFARILNSLSEPELEAILASRHPREVAVVKQTFGLYGHSPLSYEDLSENFGVTAARVQQIESRFVFAILESGVMKIYQELSHNSNDEGQEELVNNSPRKSTLGERMADTSTIMIKKNEKWIWLDSGEEVSYRATKDRFD